MNPNHLEAARAKVEKEIRDAYLYGYDRAKKGLNRTDGYTKEYVDQIMQLFYEVLVSEHERGVGIGMGRAKTAVTVAMNTGSSTLHELRAVVDKEIEWWNNNLAHPSNPNKSEEK